MNGILATGCVILVVVIGFLLLSPAPQQEAPAQQERPRYIRNADGSVSGYGRAAVDEAIREVHGQMAKDPEAFAAYRKCQQQCGYEPRDTDTPGVVTEEMGREIVARRMACASQGIDCKYPGHPYGEMAQPSSPWRATRNGLVENER